MSALNLIDGLSPPQGSNFKYSIEYKPPMPEKDILDKSTNGFREHASTLNSAASFLKKNIKNLTLDVAIRNYTTLLAAGASDRNAKHYMKTIDDYCSGYIGLNEGILELSHINISGQKARKLLLNAKPKASNFISTFFSSIYRN